VNDTEAPLVTLPGENAGKSQVLRFGELAKGYNPVEITVQGDEVPYQVFAEYTLLWSEAEPSSPDEEEISLEISYDRTSVRVGETITATVWVMLNRPGVAPLVEVELGLPPGLGLVAEDWEALVQSGIISQMRQGEGLITFYLTDLSDEEPVRFSYRLRARFPLAVRTLPSLAVDIANPQRPSVREPVKIEVNGATD